MTDTDNYFSGSPEPSGKILSISWRRGFCFACFAVAYSAVWQSLQTHVSPMYQLHVLTLANIFLGNRFIKLSSKALPLILQQPPTIGWLQSKKQHESLGLRSPITPDWTGISSGNKDC